VVQFTKVRLAGFKSFVDATELIIEPGMTGVVGPNGCGKSNLLEALRWAMGEGSARQMRGGEMDDVIFSGTSDRPARNIAEVQICLDNATRGAPAAYNEYETLEIVRRIERGAGSHYRINGKEARARDVQLLFADLSSGPRSGAIVSQGKVGDLISGKPIDRRALLEEAAGITGLHSRRHEAELRLRAAETNLARLDDVLSALANQLQGLKRQSRQASRYRNISGQIRHVEAIQLHLKWLAAEAALEAARDRLRQTEAEVSRVTGEVAQATARQAEAASYLPELRRAETAAAAALHRLTVARDALEAEEARLEATRREQETRLQQIAADQAREAAMVSDADTTLAKLDAEDGTLRAAKGAQDEDERQAGQRAAEAAAAVEALDVELTRLTEKVAADDARRAELAQRLIELEHRRTRLAERIEVTARERAELEAAGVDPAAFDEIAAAVAGAERAAEAARVETEIAEQARAAAEAAEAEGREALQRVEEERARLRAEESGLLALLVDDAAQDWPTVLNDLTVTKDYEAALGAALGDDLSASTSDVAPMFWRTVEGAAPAAALPDGVEPLARFVAAPPALARRLAQIGVVADDAAGETLKDRLAQGQRLVSKAGALWRWDGFTMRAKAATAAANRLRQKNRLAELRDELAGANSRVEDLAARFARLSETAKAATARDRAARDAARQAVAALSSAREAETRSARETAAAASRLAALIDTGDRLAGDLAEVETQLADTGRAQADLADGAGDHARLDALRGELAAMRAALRELQQAYDRLRAEAEARDRRLAAIGAERQIWQARRDGGQAQIAQLEARRTELTDAMARVAARPREIATERLALVAEIETAEAARQVAADRLGEAEARLAEIDKALKAAEAALADLREERGRSEGAVRQEEAGRQTVAERIAERLDCTPERALEAGGVAPDEELPPLDQIEHKLERLIRERDNMGPVNLRAEHEAEELGQQITSLETERADLTEAIGRFRQAISELNREGRERLLASFEKVNSHFQELFVSLFGGGTAHLALTGSDDPLEAGLEIMASPPGKRLQAMSLLSGGEQALTALSLLFAVFLTNPAPICILDEVDAPLDDANVDRFCNLLDSIAQKTGTRFLLITHHRLTMARMDRLFGVTMAERGVSQLVSVDLQQAERMRATA
jgi:chromosome segregation protein